MSSHDIVGFQVGRIEERHDDSRSPGCSAARTVDDDVHFRDQRDWEGIWMVGNVAYMSTRHLPMIPVLLAMAMVTELAGSACAGSDPEAIRAAG